MPLASFPLRHTLPRPLSRANAPPAALPRAKSTTYINVVQAAPHMPIYHPGLLPQARADSQFLERLLGKEFYRRGFAHVTWTLGNEDIIRKSWGCIMGKCYADWIYKLGKNKNHPNWRSPEAWESWMAYKQIEEAKVNGVIKAPNRKGHSGEPSVHVDSKSFIGHMVAHTQNIGQMPYLLL